MLTLLDEFATSWVGAETLRQRLNDDCCDNETKSCLTRKGQGDDCVGKEGT